VKATPKARSWQYKYPRLESNGTPFRPQPARRIFVAQLPPQASPSSPSFNPSAPPRGGMSDGVGDGSSRPWQDRVEPDLRRRVLGKMYVLLRPTGLRFIFPLVSLSSCSPAWHPWGQGSVRRRRRGVRERQKGGRESDGPQSCLRKCLTEWLIPSVCSCMCFLPLRIALV
jgi:hypothetical protein